MGLPAATGLLSNLCLGPGANFLTVMNREGVVWPVPSLESMRSALPHFIPADLKQSCEQALRLDRRPSPHSIEKTF